MTDFSNFPTIAEFDAYHRAFRTLPQSAAFHYDLAANFVFVPHESVQVEDSFDIIHEFAHSQIGNSVLGMTLQTIMECCSVIEKHIFSWLRSPLQALKDAGFADLYRELFLFGSPRKKLSLIEVRRALCEFQFEFWEDSRIGLLTNAIDRLGNRFARICKAWEFVQEVAAVYTTLHLKEESIQSNPHLLSFLSQCGLEDVSAVCREFELAATATRRRYERGIAVSKIYADAIKVGEIVSSRGGLASLWIAVLASGHFDYCDCNLFDMSDSDFERWIGDVDFTARLNRLIATPAQLEKAADQLKSEYSLCEATMRGLLDSARGSPLELFGHSITNFWRWEREKLWNSELMQVVGPIDFTGAKLFESPERYEDGKQFDFRIPEEWCPTVITAKPAIMAKDFGEQQYAIRRFVQAYEVRRTRSLLQYLREVLLD